jgi:hypothetical protein
LNSRAAFGRLFCACAYASFDASGPNSRNVRPKWAQHRALVVAGCDIAIMHLFCPTGQVIFDFSEIFGSSGEIGAMAMHLDLIAL